MALPINIAIKDKAVLYSSYMPFIENGGLFISTPKSYALGEEVFVLLALMDEADKLPIAAKIVWITPKGAQGNRAPGIGVQFADQAGEAKSKIENYLAGTLESDRTTSTL